VAGAASDGHRSTRRNARLSLATLGDLDGILPRVEAELRDLAAQGMAGKTLANRAEALAAFCRWAVRRGYLAGDPLKHLNRFDTRPRRQRRALSPAEIVALLDAAPPERRLTYEVAILSGLRRGELLALRTADLDTLRGGLNLRPEITKSRKPGFQPLPRELVERLQAWAESRGAAKAYEATYRGVRTKRRPPDDALLYIPANTARVLAQDLATAGIQARGPAGAVDFHSLRAASVSLLAEAGASVAELQQHARHATPYRTMSVYAKTRFERRAMLVERAAELLETGRKCAPGVHALAAGAEREAIKHAPIGTYDGRTMVEEAQLKSKRS